VIARARSTAAEARGRLLVLPAVAVMALVAAYPIAAGLVMSLQREIILFRERGFVGLANWAYLASDPRFLAALGRTAYFTAVAVPLEIAVALPLALVLDRPMRGRGLLRALVLLPWAIPTAVSARLWAWLLDPAFGLFARLWPGPAPNWLGRPWLALHAALLVDVWKTTPFVALVLLAGLQSIPREVYAAAEADGASRARTFLWVTLPLLEPSILVAALFRALDAFRVFDAVVVLTDGGPANGTETLSIYAYKTLVRAGDLGYGATLSSATFLSVGLIAAALLALLSRGDEGRA
jgi:multiple sugar transport system permease protein